MIGWDVWGCLGGTELEGVQGYLLRPEWKKTFPGTEHRYDEIIKTDFQKVK